MIVKKYKIKIKPLTLEDDVNTKLTLRTNKLTTNTNIKILSRIILDPYLFNNRKVYTVPRDGYLAWCLKSSRTAVSPSQADAYWGTNDYRLFFYNGDVILNTHIAEIYDAPVLIYVKVFKGESVIWYDAVGTSGSRSGVPYHIQCNVEGSPALVKKVPSACKPALEYPECRWWNHDVWNVTMQGRVWSLPYAGYNNLQQITEIFRRG